MRDVWPVWVGRRLYEGALLRCLAL
eukprot:COSAG05_NODE_18904_length_301_cov_0.440594_1_plen_24_part_10